MGRTDGSPALVSLSELGWRTVGRAKETGTSKADQTWLRKGEHKQQVERKGRWWAFIFLLLFWVLSEVSFNTRHLTTKFPSVSYMWGGVRGWRRDAIFSLLLRLFFNSTGTFLVVVMGRGGSAYVRVYRSKRAYGRAPITFVNYFTNNRWVDSSYNLLLLCYCLSYSSVSTGGPGGSLLWSRTYNVFIYSKLLVLTGSCKFITCTRRLTGLLAYNTYTYLYGENLCVNDRAASYQSKKKVYYYILKNWSSFLL